MKFQFIALLLTCSVSLQAQFDPQRYPIIPKPQTLLALSDNFPFSSNVTIVTEGKAPRKECEFFSQQVRQLYSIYLRYEKFTAFDPYIYVQLDSSFVPAEGYRMIVTKHGIDIYGTHTGVFYGLQSLLQLIQTDPVTKQLIVPGCSIIDYPRFSWRGLHLDVSRHFFPKENVKDYLRWMAMYKLNTFHWHLTDDQGWRIEIKRLPKLTQIGAWRRETLIGHFSEEPDRYDGIRYGGFYTQEEVKEIVAFADSLHITVVPEIEMPGHASALIASYPAMGNNIDSTEVQCTWGVFTQVLSPKESTFTTLEDILTEVCKLFPGQYIHIGGDECPKDEWKKSPNAQQLIKQKNLKDEHGLQSWFVQRIVNFLATKNKKAIGWDEILEGGLAEGAAVMSWRGEEGGIAAAKAKHNVVMAPGGYCYFDHYQSQNPNEPLAIGGYLPIEKVYSYDPVPSSVTVDEKKFIMGVQANVWTEYMSTFSQVQYMIFPRIAALSEVAWSSNAIKDFNSFVPRVTQHMNLYDKMKVNYSRAMFEIKPSYISAPNGIQLSLSTYSKSGVIRYSRSKSVSSSDSVYTSPIRISSTSTLTAAVFVGEQKISPDFSQSFTGHKALGKSVTLRKQPSPSYNNGGAMTLVDGITGRTPWTGSEWLGWWGDTLDAVIDLGMTTRIDLVWIGFLQDQGSWIYFPDSISFECSADGVTFQPWETKELREVGHMEVPTFSYVGRITETRFIRIRANSLSRIPEGNPGAGNPPWLFVSEIIVE